MSNDNVIMRNSMRNGQGQL